MEEDRDGPWNIHACKVCPYRSKLAFEMYKHARLHGRRSKTDIFICNTKTPEMFECEFCGFETNLKVDLTEHLHVFHEEKEDNEEMENILKCYCCKHCDFNTHSLLVFTKHVGDCNTLSGSNLYEEERRMHQMNDIFTTESRTQSGSISLEVIKTKLNLYLKQRIFEHSDLEEDIPWIECALCAFKTKENWRLKYHYTRKHNLDNTCFDCGQCSFKAKRKTSLDKHILLKHANTENILRFKCDQCDHKTKTKLGLKQHCLYKHTNSENQNICWFKCDQCDYKTMGKSHLKQHILSIHVNSKKISWFKCDQCAHKTKRKANLKHHVLCKHTNPENMIWIKCNQCSYKTKMKGYLKRHIVFKHTNFDIV